MNIEREIERAVYKIAAHGTASHQSPEHLESVIEIVKQNYDRQAYDFTTTDSLVLTQANKKRFVKQYSNIYSTENVLCQCIKQILDRTFKIKYPNRNQSIKSLFSTLTAVKQMIDFTIIKFDFKDFFNSLSSTYIFKKFLKPYITDRAERDLINRFVVSTKYAYAGLSTSNALAEIIATKFDAEVRLLFENNGLIYYERYIDDCILILNKHVEEVEIEEVLTKILNVVFHDESVDVHEKCKTEYNSRKFRYISCRYLNNNTHIFDYLGYEFYFVKGNKETLITYGITSEKRQKYEKRIDRLIAYYVDPMSPDYNNLELLRHRILAFTSRTVYLRKHYKSSVWHVKGFISNYGELRYLLDSKYIEIQTKNFLKNMVVDAFGRANINVPYFLKGVNQTNNRYNLYSNMKNNRTLLLVDHVGYSKDSLVKLCDKIGIRDVDAAGKHRGYGTLVREYLIKVKVGY